MIDTKSITLAEGLMGTDENEQAKKIFTELDKRNCHFEPYPGRRGQQFKGVYCFGDVAIARLEQIKDNQTYYFPVIMDRDIYADHIAGGKANVRMEPRNDRKPKIIIEGHEMDENGTAPRPVFWHLVTGWPENADNNINTDHIRNNTLINRRIDLRICTDAENAQNRSSIDYQKYAEFNPANDDKYTYSLARDCSHTIYAYVLMLLDDISKDQLAEVNKYVNSRRLLPSDIEKMSMFIDCCEKAGII